MYSASITVRRALVDFELQLRDTVVPIRAGDDVRPTLPCSSRHQRFTIDSAGEGRLVLTNIASVA